MGELLKELENIEETTVEEETKGFVVTDLKSATWVFRKLKEKFEKIEEIDKTAAAELDNLETKVNIVKEWQEKEKAKIERDIDFFKRFIFDYYDRESEKNPKFKLSTPYGAVKKTTRAKWTWKDDDTIVKAIKEAGLNRFIEAVETVNKAELKKELIVTEIGTVATKDGEVLDCVTVESRRTLDVTIK